MANKLKILHDRRAWHEAGDYKILSLLVGCNIKTTMNICANGNIYLNTFQSGCFCSGVRDTYNDWQPRAEVIKQFILLSVRT